jgi:hypothetical protein
MWINSFFRVSWNWYKTPKTLGIWKKNHKFQRFVGVIIKFIDHLKVFPKYIQLSKSVANCKSNILRPKYTGWFHFGLAAILKHQISEISYIISRHFQNVFIYINRLENAKL